MFLVFFVFEGLLVAGIVAGNNEGEGLFANLLYEAEKILENPVIVAFLAGLIVNYFGFLANTFITHETYDANKLMETWFTYEPVLILISQYLPMREALVWTFAIDVTRRILIAVAKTLKTPIVLTPSK